MSGGRARWTAQDEIRCLRGLAISAAAACVRYCMLILEGGRRWDPEVDSEKIKAEAARLIGPLSGLPLRAVE